MVLKEIYKFVLYDIWYSSRWIYALMFIKDVTILSKKKEDVTIIFIYGDINFEQKTII